MRFIRQELWDACVSVYEATIGSFFHLSAGLKLALVFALSRTIANFALYYEDLGPLPRLLDLMERDIGDDLSDHTNLALFILMIIVEKKDQNKEVMTLQ